MVQISTDTATDLHLRHQYSVRLYQTDNNVKYT